MTGTANGNGFPVCLWFDTQAEEAAEHYMAVFKNGSIGRVTRYPENSMREAGGVMTVEFEVNGQRFVGLNGGPMFTFNEAISFQVPCDDQDEVDYYWERLSEGGEKGPCGWVKDRFGVSWQVFPKELDDMVSDPDPAKASRAMEAMLKMGKIDLAGLRRAFAGETTGE
ncbi:VOC family protein [Yinghuangia seranimata]|uniref:VOC family protein n=1 Tax=Yinghuangia seranimata TaxID=408067 RepID=UPI00248AC734|nr:VOC family protein [Yinghuangia seranimata]MDI2126931.1 VOC family protein [Yinghuangia seranimata]